MLDHSPPLIAPAASRYRPATQYGAIQSVTIELTAGGEPAAVPESAKAAILLCLAYWYENRGDMPAAVGMPSGAKLLLDLLSTGAYW
ncbi:phage gp6-like head-tail connector protein [Gemmata sp. G18]|uniref:Phage gp6-like head-tail connector protein n=1 Tax=Gemmata palustris TaxID=2822762 RepID=A0ABS5BUK8_9BACT|nr:head-tail connector protein [Gemmata palustris]MBP3957345.1 phage gp6-like head-tail connector protein [Gemmata palustris]